MNNNWSLAFRYWISTLIIFITAYVFWYARDIFGPLIGIVLLALILDPLISYLTKKTKISRTLIIKIVFLLGIILLSFIMIILIPKLILDIQILIPDIQEIFTQFQLYLSKPIIIFQQEINLEDFLPNFDKIILDSILSIPENIYHLIETTTKNLIWLLIILVSTYYLLKESAQLRFEFFRLIPVHYQQDIHRLYFKLLGVWRGYIQGNLLLILIIGIVFSITWIIIGVPGGLALGILTGVLAIIPDIGPVTAVGLTILVAYFDGSSVLHISNSWFALMVLGIYLLLINIINIFIRPKIFSRSVNMHEGVVFISILVAVLIMGIQGAIIVIPLIASVSILAKYLYFKIVGIPPWPEDTIINESSK